MERKTGFIILSAAVLLIFSAALLLHQARYTGMAVQREGYTVKIGYKPDANFIPLFVALENGYFEQEGLRVETFRFDSTNDMMDAFAAGRIDATPTGNVVVSYSLEASSPGLFRIHSPNFYTTEKRAESFVARIGSGIRTYGDLDGKTIGANKGIFARIMTKKFLEKQGVVGFRIIELDEKVQLEALATGQIDALVSLEPNPTMAVERGIAEYIEGGAVYAKTVDLTAACFSGGVVSTSLLREHPDEAGKFLRAMKKSIGFINENPNESRLVLTKHIPIKMSTARKIPLSDFRYALDLTEEEKELAQKSADFLFNEGIIKKKVDTGSLLLKQEDLE